jgi:hypothetical protein
VTEPDEIIRSGRPPWWVMALAGAVIAVAVGGNIAAGWMNRTEPTPTTRADRPLDELVVASRFAIVGRVEQVELVSDAEEPEVIARVLVLESLGRAAPAAGARVTVYDVAFDEAWKEGERALLFLADSADPRAEARVLPAGRFLLDDSLARPMPFSLEEVRAAFSAG